MKLNQSCLDEKVRCSLLLYVYRHRFTKVNITDPLNVISKSYRAIRNSAMDLEKERMIQIERKKTPKREYILTITDKGENIAYRLLEIEEILL